MDPAAARACLDDFDRAIARELHVLSACPALTWQQLHNRLRWEGGPPARDVLARQAAERARRGGPPAISRGAESDSGGGQ